MNEDKKCCIVHKYVDFLHSYDFVCILALVAETRKDAGKEVVATGRNDSGMRALPECSRNSGL